MPIWKQCSPCPHCGEHVAAASSEDDDSVVFWFIECPKCPAAMESYKGAGELVAAWNQRVT